MRSNGKLLTLLTLFHPVGANSQQEYLVFVKSCTFILDGLHIFGHNLWCLSPGLLYFKLRVVIFMENSLTFTHTGCFIVIDQKYLLCTRSIWHYVRQNGLQNFS